MLNIFLMHVFFFLALNMEIGGDDEAHLYVMFNYQQAKEQLEALGTLLMKAYEVSKEMGTMVYDRINATRS